MNRRLLGLATLPITAVVPVLLLGVPLAGDREPVAGQLDVEVLLLDAR